MPTRLCGWSPYIESAGAKVRFLPPNSPDFNPIEKMWSKMKEFLRSAKARTLDSLLDATAAALKTIMAKDVEGRLDCCGYVNIQS